MAAIQAARLCEDFEMCVGWPYRSPGGTKRDCSACGIDCSGMFVRAYRLQGANIAHGSNTIWRKHLKEKGKLTDAGQLEKGMAVFKHKEEDTAKYPDGEGDFYHIGLVTGVNPVRIVHASTEGMQVRAEAGLSAKWTHWGRLKAVADEAAPALPPARVTAPDGNPVKLRAKPSKGCGLYWMVPVGAEVTVLEEDGAWWHVRYQGREGYMMAEFLERG